MAKRLDALLPVDYQQNGENRTRWVRLGVAFENKDGSMTVLLDAQPTAQMNKDGKLETRFVLREPLPPRDEKPSRQSDADQPF